MLSSVAALIRSGEQWNQWMYLSKKIVHEHEKYPGTYCDEALANPWLLLWRVNTGQDSVFYYLRMTVTYIFHKFHWLRSTMGYILRNETLYAILIYVVLSRLGHRLCDFHSSFQSVGHASDLKFWNILPKCFSCTTLLLGVESLCAELIAPAPKMQTSILIIL